MLNGSAYWFIALSLLLVGCGAGDDVSTLEQPRLRVPDPCSSEYVRGLVQAETVGLHGGRATDEPTRSFVPAHLDTLLVDPTATLMFGVAAEPYALHADEVRRGRGAFRYRAYGLFGTRERASAPWAVYRDQSFVSYDHVQPSEAREDARRYYFQEVAGVEERVGQRRAYEYVAYGANAGDPSFWNAPIWDVGGRLPGLRNFQVGFRSEIDPDTRERRSPWYELRPIGGVALDSLRAAFTECVSGSTGAS